jgi:membrane protein YqaA with SNARE-associated domain
MGEQAGEVTVAGGATDAVATAPAPKQRHPLVRAVLWPIALLHRLYLWVVGWADRPGGTWALGAISFAESSFFPIPPDPLMWALCIGKRERSFWFATVTTVTSVLGGVFGWILGMYLFADIVDVAIRFFGAEMTWYGTMLPHSDPGFADAVAANADSEAYFPKLHAAFNAYAFWAILAGALTPIPYKATTIAAGLFGVPLPVLVGASVLGRGSRFYAFGALFHFFGDHAKRFIEKYFAWISIAMVLMFFAGFYALKHFL